MATFMRFMHKGREMAGRLEDGVLVTLDGAFPASFTETGERIALTDIEKILPPVRPEKLIAIGLNYVRHTAEFKATQPKEPVMFLLATSSLTGQDSMVPYPSATRELSYEAELAVVMGKRCFHVSETEATRYIFGYTCANDVSARDIQRQDGQWGRSKSFSGFTPMGPHIVTDIDASDLAISFRLNGEVKQNSRTSEMVFGISHLISFLSSFMPLEPGDVILTGTPGGVGLVQPGDVMEVEIEKIGVLKNTVK